MIRIDEYTARGATRAAGPLRDAPEGLALVAAAVAAGAHFPANGARVIYGWIDTDGQPVIADHPVLWFDNEGDPVTLNSDGIPESARDCSDPWMVYHPDVIPRIGSDEDPRELTIACIARRLTEQAAPPKPRWTRWEGVSD